MIVFPPSSSSTIFPFPIVTKSSSGLSSRIGLMEVFFGVVDIGGVKGVLVEEEEQEEVVEQTELDLLSFILFPVVTEQGRSGDLGGLLLFDSISFVLTLNGLLVRSTLAVMSCKSLWRPIISPFGKYIIHICIYIKEVRNEFNFTLAFLLLNEGCGLYRGKFS